MPRMSQFAILSLFTLALGAKGDIYNLRKGGEWKLRGLCPDFTPLEIRKKEGKWQLFAVEEGEDAEELLATLEPPPAHHQHHHDGSDQEQERRVRRQLSGIGGYNAPWAGGAVKGREDDKETRNAVGNSGSISGENTRAAKGQRTNIIYLGVQPEAMKGFGRSEELRELRAPVHPEPPVGLHRWTLLREDACLLQLPIPTLMTAAEMASNKFRSKEEKERGPPGSTLRDSGKPVELLLTRCNENQFTCHDGSCIPISNLCDNVPDCPMMPGGRKNTYDERKCGIKVRKEILHGPPPFLPDLLIEHNPDGTLERAPVTVNVSLLEFDIKGVSEVDHKFYAKFQLVYEWYERRITWHNLKDEETLNELSEHHFEKLFVPSLLFKNTKTMERTKLDSATELFGRKEGVGKKPGDKELLEVALFSGSENPVVYSRSYFLEFTQDFDLQFYPFDEQLVTVEICPTQPAIKLMPELLDFVGSIDMRRFTVQSWSIEQRVEGKRLKDQLVVVKIQLKRRVTQVYFRILFLMLHLDSQVLLSTYLPSLCILVLAQVR